jgi:hypothetical protein
MHGEVFAVLIHLWASAEDPLQRCLATCGLGHGMTISSLTA